MKTKTCQFAKAFATFTIDSEAIYSVCKWESVSIKNIYICTPEIWKPNSASDFIILYTFEVQNQKRCAYFDKDSLKIERKLHHRMTHTSESNIGEISTSFFLSSFFFCQKIFSCILLRTWKKSDAKK